MDDTKPVFLDYNATTPLDKRVFEAMKPWLLEPANAGSRTHVFGQRAKEAVDAGRKQLASLLGAGPEEIIFTSGATESNNLAILGLADFGQRTGRRHLISTVIEHKAVLEPLQRMQQAGFEVEFVPVGPGGFIEASAIEERLRPDTLLVSVMHANNETGVLQPVEEIGALLKETETLFHTDAAQTFGKEVDELRSVSADLISVSSHKVYGPQGIGALYVRRRTSAERPLKAISVGGGQERGLRPGTLPVALIVGIGRAAELASEEHLERRQRAVNIKEQLLFQLRDFEHHVNGEQSRCQDHVLNVRFPGVDSEALLMAVRDEVSISNGSACTSSSYAPSHVLVAMGLKEDEATESVRISWGPGVKEIPGHILIEAVEKLCVQF